MATQGKTKTISAGIAGNVLEWYDFAVYAYMVPFISQLFFPDSDPTASVLASFGAFAAGYFARPLGGVFFGWIGDIFGRKAALQFSVALMGAATVAMGLLPTYSAIGEWAPVLLVLLRILQGMSVGGEYTSSITFVMEHAPAKRRCFMTSFIGVGATLGFLLGSGVGAIIDTSFSNAEITAWAWRIPFLSGVVIMVTAFMIRYHTAEPPRKESIKLDAAPVVVALRDHWREMLKLMGLAAAVNANFYFAFVYMEDFLVDEKGMSNGHVLAINTACLALMTVLIPVMGWMGDRFGRKPILLVGSLALILLVTPFFSLMQEATLLGVMLGQIGFAIVIAIMFGVNPATQAELVPESVRVTAFSVAYGVVLAIFGGTTPLVAGYVLKITGWTYSPALYMVFVGCISLAAIMTVRESRPAIARR